MPEMSNQSARQERLSLTRLITPRSAYCVASCLFRARLIGRLLVNDPSARETRDAVLKEKIMEVWKGEKGREVYGARKVWLELNRQGVVVARCTVERLMRELGIGGARASTTAAS